jgi:hypothetical protein
VQHFTSLQRKLVLHQKNLDKADTQISRDRPERADLSALWCVTGTSRGRPPTSVDPLQSNVSTIISHCAESLSPPDDELDERLAMFLRSSQELDAIKS